MSIQNNPLQPKIHESSKTDSPKPTQTPPEIETSSGGSVSSRIELFEKMSGKSGKVSESVIDSETQTKMGEGLDSSSPQSLQEKSTEVPKPGNLNEVLDQLKQVKKESPGHGEGGVGKVSQGVQDLDDRLEQERIARFQKSHDSDNQALGDTTLRDHSDVVKSPTFDTGKLVDNLGLKHVDVTQFLTDRFSSFERDLHDLILPHKKDAVLLKAGQSAEQLIFGANLKNDLTLQLSSMSDDQLKEFVAAAVGKMKASGTEKSRDKYGDQAAFSDLSKDKQALTLALVAGIKKGLARTQGEMIMTYSRQMTQNLSTELAKAGPNSDLVFELTLKSGDDLRLDLAKHLKMLPGDGKLTQLSPSQRNLLDKFVKDLQPVIQKGLPNTAPDATTVVHTEPDGKEHKAPATITLNGKTYGAPKYLGQGGLGLVILYTNLNDPNDKVVAKSLLKITEKHQMVDELRVHRHAMGGEHGTGHDNVVKLRGAVSGSDGGLYMVMDLAGGGDLKKLNKTLGIASTSLLPPKAQLALIQHFMHGIVSGSLYLQSQNVMHLDNKGENAMLDSDGHVKIGDLGSGQVASTIDSSTHRIPTTFKPMEWVNKGELTHKTDIFQLGRMLYVMAGGKDRNALVNVEQEARVQLEGQHKQAPDDAPDLQTFLDQNSYLKNSSMFQLMKSMLDKDPSKRPTLEGVLEHSFLKEYNPEQTGFPELLKAMMAYDKKAGAMMRALDKEILELDVDQSKKSYDYRNDPSPQKKLLMDQAVKLHQDKLAELRDINQHPEVQALAEALKKAGENII